jgi:hypothetical protein
VPSLQSWRPCYFTEKSRCGLGTLKWDPFNHLAPGM